MASALLLFAACAAPGVSQTAPTPAAATLENEPSALSSQTAPATAATAPASDEPRVFVLDPQALVSVRASIRSGDQSFDAALARLTKDATKALRAGPFSVTTKSVTP